MKTKICTKCKKDKLLIEFPVNKPHKDNRRSHCKKCCYQTIKDYYKKYPWKNTYQWIKTRCNNQKYISYKNYGGRGIKCLITVEELKQLWFRDKAYEMKKPSIDREDDDGNYEFSNCRYIEFKLNIERQNKTRQEKPVNQYDLNGDFIKTWKTGKEIQRSLGFSQGNISSACLGRYKTAYGFVWKHK